MNVVRKDPLNFDLNHTNIFSGWKNYTFPELKVLVVNDAYFNNDGYVWTGNGEELIKDSLINPRWNNPGPLTMAQKRSAIKIDNPVTIWNCNWNHNYYHFWCDSIPRLLQMEQHNDIEVILSTFDNTPDREWVLEKMGFYNRRKVTSNTIYYSPKLFLPKYNNYSNGQQHPLLVNRLREIFLLQLDSEINLGEKIYIKRDDRLTPESMKILDRVAKQYGYTEIRCENYSYLQQMSIFNKAKYVLGIHGAGMTNLLWCKEGTVLIELRNKEDKCTPYYYNLVNAIGGEYVYVLGTWVSDISQINGEINTARSIMSINEIDLVKALDFVEKRNVNSNTIENTIIDNEIVRKRPIKIIRKPLEINI